MGAHSGSGRPQPPPPEHLRGFAAGSTRALRGPVLVAPARASAGLATKQEIDAAIILPSLGVAARGRSPLTLPGKGMRFQAMGLQIGLGWRKTLVSWRRQILAG